MVSPEFSAQFPSFFFPHSPCATYVEPYYAVILKWIPAVPILLPINIYGLDSYVVYVNMIDTLLGDHGNPSLVELVAAPSTKY